MDGHVSNGYNYMLSFRYDEDAKICLTHHVYGRSESHVRRDKNERIEGCMKNIYKLCGKTSLCFYLLFLYQAWYVCQYGGLRRHLLILLISLSGILLSSVLWMIARKKMQQTS